MRFSLLLAGSLMASVALSAQVPKGFTNGTYSFLPRTAAYDPQFDAWRIQVAADSTRVFDPDGNVFLISLTKMLGDTLQWTDVAGPCTGVVARYKLVRDSIGIGFDLIDDACTDRATAIVTMYLVPVKKTSDESPADRARLHPALLH
ncbi:MAG: hypothetical protein ACRENH_00275 [Gemmatimonadaceae bacterium]